MKLAEVQRRVRVIAAYRRDSLPRLATDAERKLYRDTLRTLLDHDLPDDARQLIEAALEAER